MGASLEDKPNQMLRCVDQRGNETHRTIDRRSAHTLPGVKHLAIQIMVFNSRKELILHERPARKVGGNVMDCPSTHVLSGESTIDAAYRCLRDEYGITERPEIKVLDGYSYEKDYGDGSCENEFCLALLVVYDGKVQSTEEAQLISNVPARKVLEELRLTPERYPPWFKESVKKVLETPEGKALFS